MLTVIRTPTHEEHDSILRWLGGRFDPEKFDPKRVKFDDPARRYGLRAAIAAESPGAPYNKAG